MPTGESLNSLAIDLQGHHRFLLGLIHGIVGSAVDQYIRFMVQQSLFNRVELGYIEFREVGK